MRQSTMQAKEDLREMADLEQRQAEVRAKKLEEIKERFEGESVNANQIGRGPKRLQEYLAYQGPSQVPAVEPRPSCLQFDVAAHALLVPIHGSIVPFHVSMIKNMSRSTLDGLQLLRVNFFAPGLGKGIEDFPEATPQRVFIKEFTFRSAKRENLDGILRLYKEAQRNLKQLESEAQTSGRRGGSALKPAGPLQLSRNYPVLRDVNMRPNLSASSRRTVGNVEAHSNGFRFCLKGSSEKIEVLYDRVKLAVFQPCESNSLLVLIHLHLHEPMAFGKKRTQDVQFFTEVGNMTEDLGQRKVSSAYDPDEILEEQNENKMKEQKNKIFLEFCKQVQQIPGKPIEFDKPSPSFAFQGVPHRSCIDLAFGKKSLVGVQEWPPLCIDMSEIDIVVFERAVINLREFDMVLIKKDYSEVPLRITTIPKQFLDRMKFYFGTKKMVWYAISMSMQWAAVMKQVTTNKDKFIQDGGWDAWFNSAASEEDSDDSADQESDFASQSDDGDDDGSGSTADDDESAFSDDDDDDSESGGDAGDEEEGLSWEELEARAEKADKKRERDRSVSPGAGGRKPPSVRPKKRAR